jgi:hypothetical protein
VLAKDYYSDSQKRNLEIDYLKTIDSSTWEELRRSFGMSAVISGIPIGGSYNEFNQKRTSYLESVKYRRSESEARSIIQIATSDRAYTAYEACLRTTTTGSPIRVWAARETMDSVELRVKYVNPAGVPRKTLESKLIGGSVKGAQTGELWSKSASAWGVMEEKTFTISRTPGTSSTVVTVFATDNTAPPVSVTFQRADATFTLDYVGTTEVSRGLIEALVGTPDNNHRGCNDNCVRKVGCDSGKYCVSQTRTNLDVLAPFSIRNPGVSCSGVGCGWASVSQPTMTGNNSASATVNNWGHPVTLRLFAEKYEAISGDKCGLMETVPVVNDAPIVFSVRSECRAIAALKWNKLTGAGGQGVIKFGDPKSADGTVEKVGADVVTGDAISISYKLVK